MRLSLVKKVYRVCIKAFVKLADCQVSSQSKVRNNLQIKMSYPVPRSARTHAHTYTYLDA